MKLVFLDQDYDEKRIEGMNLQQGDLENIILNGLWDLEYQGVEPIFVVNIQEEINSSEKQWAYTTVKTVLDRLVEKELISREKLGKRYTYRSVTIRNQVGLSAIHKVARQYFKNDMNKLLSCLQAELSSVSHAISA